MRKVFLIFAATSLILCGCRGNSYPKVKQAGVSNVTYVGAFSNYGRVYKTTYAVLNQYALIKHANYSQGSIVAEFLTNREYLDKTRTMVYANIKKRGKFLFDPKYYDVEIRVVKQIDTSEVNPFSKTIPPYRWRTVHFDQQIETKLMNKIKLAMTKGGYLQKKNILADGSSKTSKTPKAGKADKNTAVAKGKTEKVKEDYVSHTPKSEKNNFNSYVLLGSAYTNQDRWDMAVVYFRSALAYTPNQQEGYYYLSAGYMGNQKYDLALETLAKGLGLREDASQVYLLELFANEDQFSALAKKLVGTPQKDLLRAFLYLGMGRNGQAKQILQGIQRDELKSLVKKLQVLANQKKSSYRKFY